MSDLAPEAPPGGGELTDAERKLLAREMAVTRQAAAQMATPGRTPVEALAAELDRVAVERMKKAGEHESDSPQSAFYRGAEAGLTNAAGRIRHQLAPAWDGLVTERDMLAAELQGVHAELRACGVQGDPGNHWAPALVSMLARDRRAVTAERDDARQRLATQHEAMTQLRSAHSEALAGADSEVSAALKTASRWQDEGARLIAERDRYRVALEDARHVLQSIALGTAGPPHVSSVTADKAAGRIREALEAGQ